MDIEYFCLGGFGFLGGGGGGGGGEGNWWELSFQGCFSPRNRCGG